MDALNDVIEMNRRAQVLKQAYYDEEVEDLSRSVKRLDAHYAMVGKYKVNYVANFCPCPAFHFSPNRTCKHIDAVRKFLERTKPTHTQEVLG